MKKVLLFLLVSVIVIGSLVLTSCDITGLFTTTTTASTTSSRTSATHKVENHYHDFGEWEVVREVTDVDEGLEVRYCECGRKDERYTHAGSEGLLLEVNPWGYSYRVVGRGTCTDSEIVIPNTYDGLPITVIGEEAFRQDELLTSIVLSDSVQKIEFWAFYNCQSLESITFGNSLTTINEQAFTHCKLLKNVDLPDSLIYIGKGTFSSCESLTEITIPKSVETILESAFDCNYNFTNIYVDEENKTFKDIDGVLFSKDGSVLIYYPKGRMDTSYTLPASVKKINADAFNFVTAITELIIPSGITHIDDRAFEGFGYSTTICIPDTVVSIGSGALAGNFISIEVDVNNQHYKSIDGNLYTKDGKTLVQYATGKQEKSFVIPDFVTRIGDYAFESTSLESIIIHNSITHIGNYAFSFAESLNNIVIPDSVTVIADGAFSSCFSLESLRIPDTVVSIGENAFFSCDSLTSIEIPSSVKTIGDRAFYSCDNLVTITIPSSVTSIGFYVFTNCGNLRSIYYDGSMNRWDNVTNNYTCISGVTPLNFDIYCTDGTIHIGKQ